MSQKDTDIVQQLQIETERGEHLYTLERPVWGYRSLTVGALRDHRDAILELASVVREEGGVLAVPYQEGQEQDVITLLLLVLSGVKARGEPARLIHPLTHPVVAAHDVPPGSLLIHQVTRIAGALEALEQGPAWWRGRVVIATGPADEWGRLSSRLPIRVHPLPPAAPPVLGEAVDTERDLLARDHVAAEAYTLVAAFDAFGVALPLSLLARTLGLDEDQTGLLVEGARGLLYWVEREKPPGLLVSTKGEPVARCTLEALYGRQTEALLQESHRRVLQALNPREDEERHAAIRVFQVLLAKGRRPWARGLAECVGLNPILAQATAPECLAWGAILTNLDLPELAARAIWEAREKDADRPSLLPENLATLKGHAASDPVLAGAARGQQPAGVFPLLGRALDFVFQSILRLAGSSTPLPEGMAAASRSGFSLSSEEWKEGDLKLTVAPDRREHLVVTCEEGHHPCQGVEVAIIEVAPDRGQHIRASARTDSRGHADLGALDGFSPAVRIGQYVLRVHLPEA